MRRLLTTALISATAGALITYYFISSSTSICMDYSADNMSTLDADLIHTMTRGYKKNQLSYIQTELGTIAPIDASAIWFDLVTLKKYLYHIEKKSKIDDSKLGVRFYYASYPKSTDSMAVFRDLRDASGHHLISPEYKGLHTLVMIPTVKDSVGNDIDFNPLDSSTFKEGFSQKSQYTFGSTSTLPDDTAALSATPSRDMGARNHGYLTPPKAAVGLGF
jgi:hypothetical protein